MICQESSDSGCLVRISLRSPAACMDPVPGLRKQGPKHELSIVLPELSASRMQEKSGDQSGFAATTDQNWISILSDKEQFCAGLDPLLEALLLGAV